MRQFEHATIEWYWTPPQGSDAPPSFVIFMPDGSTDRRVGSNVEVTLALTELGGRGFEAVSCITAGNWILWTLKREVQMN
jgi:hypothetical protein